MASAGLSSGNGFDGSTRPPRRKNGRLSHNACHSDRRGFRQRRPYKTETRDPTAPLQNTPFSNGHGRLSRRCPNLRHPPQRVRSPNDASGSSAPAPRRAHDLLVRAPPPTRVPLDPLAINDGGPLARDP